LAATDSSGVSLLTIMTRANGVLAGYDVPAQSSALGSTMVDLVRDAYLTQARLALAMFVGGAVAVGLLMLVINGIIGFINYRVSRDN